MKNKICWFIVFFFVKKFKQLLFSIIQSTITMFIRSIDGRFFFGISLSTLTFSGLQLHHRHRWTLQPTTPPTTASQGSKSPTAAQKWTQSPTAAALSSLLIVHLINRLHLCNLMVAEFFCIQTVALTLFLLHTHANHDIILATKNHTFNRSLVCSFQTITNILWRNN